MKINVLFFYFIFLNTFAMGQDKDLLYQPIPLASIKTQEITLISCSFPGEKYKNFKMIIYPSLDSIRTRFISEFKQELPERIIFLININKSVVTLNSVKAKYGDRFEDLNVKAFNFICYYIANSKSLVSTELSIPIKL